MMQLKLGMNKAILGVGRVRKNNQGIGMDSIAVYVLVDIYNNLMRKLTRNDSQRSGMKY